MTKHTEISPGRPPEEVSVMEMVPRPGPIEGTILGRAVNDLNDEAGGRFGVAKAPATIVGLTASPVMPGTAPGWSKDLNLPGDEPPLGIAVDAVQEVEGAALVLRRHAGELAAVLGDLDAFWQDRIGKLVDTLMDWADRIDGSNR
jgi:hypothetical protein